MNTTQEKTAVPETGQTNTRVIDGQVFRRVKDPRKRSRNPTGVCLPNELRAEFLVALGGREQATVLRELIERFIAETKERTRVAAEGATNEKAA